MHCIDLDEVFGTKYRVRNETGIPEKPKQRDPWLREIRCKRGRIYPMGGRMLAAYVGSKKSNVTPNKLLSIPGTKAHQVGDTEAVVLFEMGSSAQKEIFTLLRPFVRRRGGKGNASALQAYLKSRHAKPF